MRHNGTKGISVIICCHNSSGRLEKTLNALAKQHLQVMWEVIVVDNASSDNTSGAAAALWDQAGTEIGMRIVSEHRPGLSYARRKGVEAALYSYLLFCDDDNWLAPGYMQGMFDILESDRNIAACGGMGVPVFEIPEPYWFYEYAEAFALGSQEINNENGRILNLYGAGLTVRKSSIDELYNSGFNSVLKDRTGQQLSSSGDTELTYAFILMGYKLACTDELKFFHFLSGERLSMGYLNALFRSFGNDGPVRNLYYSYISKRFFHRYIKNWSFHFGLSIFRLVKYYIVPPKKFGRRIYLNWSIAYIRQLISLRGKYPDLKRQITGIMETGSSTSQSISRENILSFES